MRGHVRSNVSNGGLGLMKERKRRQQVVTDSDIDEIASRDEAGVGAMVDTYLPAELIYLEAAATMVLDPSDAPIRTASVTPSR